MIVTLHLDSKHILSDYNVSSFFSKSNRNIKSSSIKQLLSPEPGSGRHAFYYYSIGKYFHPFLLKNEILYTVVSYIINPSVGSSIKSR